MRVLKVLVVTGSYELGNELQKILDSDSELVLAARADNAYTARDMIIEYMPDVMLLSAELPKLSGLTFLERLMPQFPIPAVMIGSGEVRKQAYETGAADFIVWNGGDVRMLSQAQIPKRLRQAVFPGIVGSRREMMASGDKAGKHVIAIGASTGGTEAIQQVIKELHGDVPGIVMVQHMPAGFTKMYAQRLDRECELEVREAKSGDYVRKGQVLLAPGDRHMRLIEVSGRYQVECRQGEKVSGHCPSVDVLFDSVAKTAGADAIGVLLTGMGRDGAKGLLAMKRQGAVTIGQDEKTSVVYGMPKEAYMLGAVTYQLALEQIAPKIYTILGGKQKTESKNREVGNV